MACPKAGDHILQVVAMEEEEEEKEEVEGHALVVAEFNYRGLDQKTWVLS